MTREERRKLARNIAKYEKMIQRSKSKETIEFAKSKIEELITSANFDLEDMMYIDDLIQKTLV